MSAVYDFPAVERRYRTENENYYITYMLRIQCIGYIEGFFGNFPMAVSCTFRLTRDRKTVCDLICLRSIRHHNKLATTKLASTESKLPPVAI